MAADPWEIDGSTWPATSGARLGIAGCESSPEALNELHEAQVRSVTFDNIDVLIGQHPGVGLAAVQEKVRRAGRGGYCFPPAEAEARRYPGHQRPGRNLRRSRGSAKGGWKVRLRPRPG